MTSRISPRVTLDNYDAVYDFYETNVPSKLALKALHRAAGVAIRPRIHYAPPQRTELAIENSLTAGHSLIIVSNHRSQLRDIPTQAAAIQNSALKGVVGDTIALAKAPLFKYEWSSLLLNLVGAVPVFSERRELKGSSSQDRYDIAARLSRVAVNHLTRGKHLFVFPEGTTNKEYPVQLLEIGRGVEIMARGAVRRGAKVDIVPSVIWYGDDLRRLRSPDVMISEPIPVETSSKDITQSFVGIMSRALVRLSTID